MSIEGGLEEDQRVAIDNTKEIVWEKRMQMTEETVFCWDPEREQLKEDIFFYLHSCGLKLIIQTKKSQDNDYTPQPIDYYYIMSRTDQYIKIQELLRTHY